mmetsp:Transcript_3167/g.11071  ORF Transcript_3167/g.11071 Transcript_3167/m.11071 type:complete len:249 (-) Transcript_3167:500-1246(-)
MLEEDFEREIKVLVVGNGNVGKTSMIRRYCKGVYTDEYKKTIGVDFLEKSTYIQALGEEVRLMLWDTAGQEEFESITRAYYRGAGACVLTFSTVDRDSFDALPKWMDKVQQECGPIAMCLVQNKVDLIDQAVVTPEEAENMARRLQLKFYRTCVKENLNVDAVFEYLAERGAGQTESAVDTIQAPTLTPAGDGQGAPAPALQPAAPAVAKEAGAGPAQPETVTLGQPTRRTKGKKSLKKRLSKSCSVL